MTDELNPNWANEIRSVLVAIKNSQAAARSLGEWVWANVVALDVQPRELPPEVAEQLGQLRDALEVAHSAAAGLFDDLCSTPGHKLIRGHRLSRPEYLLLAAQNLVEGSHKSVGLSDLDDYEVFDMFFYEDDERACYINPSLEARKPGRIKFRFGVRPEELSFERLRPKQRRFFETRLPEIASRFKREA